MSDKTTQSRTVRRNKKRRFRKRALIILIPMLVVLFSLLGYGTYLYTKAESVISDSYKDDGRDKSDLREEQVDPSEDNVSILIVGVDESEERANQGQSRSDTLILATLNKEDKSVKMVSIPRDSYVYVPEVDYKTKINHAHAYGGVKASIETVENLMDIPVDYYVKMNFNAFIEVVNAVNGITVNVPYELYEQNSKDQKNAVHLLPGEHQLNGEEALALARTRKFDNDIERGKRQQEIIKAVVKKAVSVNSILKIGNVIDAVGENMTTNMSFDEMKSFVSYGTSGDGIDFETMSLAGRDYQPGDTYYWKLDEAALAETQQKLKQHLELTDKNTEEDSTNDN